MVLRLTDDERGGLNGWVEAGLFVLAISALTVVYAIAQQAGAHIVVFILYAMGFAAAGMLALTGLGEAPLKVAFARESLIFGWSTVLLEAFYFLLLGVLTPAETSLSLRLSVPVSLLVGWLFFRREMTGRLWLGSVIIVAAVVPILMGVDADVRVYAGLLALICSLVVAVKTFASEFHPANRAARNLSDKLRVTGLVVLATSLIGATIVLPLVLLAAAGVIPQGSIIPPVVAFSHVPTLITAIVVGAPVFVAMTYLTFSSVVKIGTESFLATSAFTPFSVLAIEILAAAAGLLTLETFDMRLMPFIALGIIGVLIVVHARHHGGRSRESR
jgi:drug/metabolite transporter (DMT)-like permease